MRKSNSCVSRTREGNQNHDERGNLLILSIAGLSFLSVAPVHADVACKSRAGCVKWRTERLTERQLSASATASDGLSRSCFTGEGGEDQGMEWGRKMMMRSLL